MKFDLARFLVATSLCLAACSASHGEGDDDASVAIDGSTSAFDAGDGSVTLPVRDASADGEVTPPRFRDGSVPMPPDGVTSCGGAECAPTEICCLLSSTCFDPSRPSDCALPPGTTDPEACASNADCGTGEYCEHPGGGSVYSVCGGGVGSCIPVREPTECGVVGDGVCGCDGRTYPDPCAASRAGVRTSWDQPCGTSLGAGHNDCDAEHRSCPEGQVCDTSAGTCVALRPIVVCGLDSQCPEGFRCCGVAGMCVPDSCPDCCYAPPEGTRALCRTDADCLALDRRGYYCDGAGCGTPGGCRRRAAGCGGVLDPVCGCDGTTYTNECWAQEAGVRVAASGECP